MSTTPEPTRVEVQKQVSWCLSGCGVVNTDDPEWAADHHARHGCHTARRSWTVESWVGDA